MRDRRLNEFMDKLSRNFDFKNEDSKLEVFDKKGHHALSIWAGEDIHFYLASEFSKVSRSLRKVLLDNAFKLVDR